MNRTLRPLQAFCGDRPITYRMIAIGFCALLTGCGDDMGTVPVTGRVTLDGKPMPAAGSVNFLPIESADGFPSRPGQGRFESDGEYSATSFEEGDGLFPGRYRVSVHCWEVPPTMGGPPPVSHLPKKYAKGFTSEIDELVVEPGKPVEMNYDLK